MNTNSSITSSDWLATATKKLRSANIGSARLDSLLILSQVLGLSKIDLISRQDIKLNHQQTQDLNDMLVLRLKHVPVAYIRGLREFYGRNFIVDSNVLIPRPDSEILIDLAKTIELNNSRVADIGCGSGCLGITLKLEVPNINVDLIDISPLAIKVARKNSELLNAKVSFIQVNLLNGLVGRYKLFLVNLPYLPDHMKKLIDLKDEPKLALFSGLDGLDAYRLFWKQLKDLKNKPEHILSESLLIQHDQMEKLALDSSYKLNKVSGLIQQFKLV